MLHETIRNDDFLYNTALGMLQPFETMLQPRCTAVLQIVPCNITFKPDVLFAVTVAEYQGPYHFSQDQLSFPRQTLYLFQTDFPFTHGTLKPFPPLPLPFFLI